MLSDALTKQKCIFKKKTLLKKKTKLFLGTWGGPSIIIRYLMDGTAVVFWIHLPLFLSCISTPTPFQLDCLSFPIFFSNPQAFESHKSRIQCEGKRVSVEFSIANETFLDSFSPACDSSHSHACQLISDMQAHKHGRSLKRMIQLQDLKRRAKTC